MSSARRSLVMTVVWGALLGQGSVAFAQDEEASKPDASTPDASKAKEEPPEEKFIEDDDSWSQSPFETDDEEWELDFPGERWAGAGAFVGRVHRPSGSDEIKYKAGVAYGGYLRPQITSWLDARIYYRQESIPVELSEGAYDYDGESHNLDFEQPNLEVINIGFRLEPVWVLHPRFRLRGILGWSWLGFRAEMPQAPGYNDPEEGERGIGGSRKGVEMNFTFGGGLSWDVIDRWLDLSLDGSYSLPASQTGSAFEAQQIVVDGVVTHIAPLPKFKNSSDIILSIGIIL